MTYLAAKLDNVRAITGTLASGNGGTGIASLTASTVVASNADGTALECTSITTTAGNLILATGKVLKIVDDTVLTASTLGDTVVDSSLQNLGVQDANLRMGTQLIIDVNCPVDDDAAVTSLDYPLNIAVNKTYLSYYTSAVVRDLPMKASVYYATTGALSSSFSDGGSLGDFDVNKFTLTFTVGNTITAFGVTDVTPSSLIGKRVLVAGQTTVAHNGIYAFSSGSSTTLQLKLADDNTTIAGSTVSVRAGVHAGKVFYLTSTAYGWNFLQQNYNVTNTRIPYGDGTGVLATNENFTYVSGTLSAGTIKAATALQIGDATVLSSSTLGSAITSSSLTTLGDQTEDLNMGVDVNNLHRIHFVELPAAPTDVATKAYVDAFSNGTNFKDPVDAASTANVGVASVSGNTLTLSGVGITSLDGVTMTDDASRILLKNQTAGEQNGVYTYTDSTHLVRSADLDTTAADEFTPGTSVYVSAGTVNAGMVYTLITKDITLNSTPLEFIQSNGIPAQLTSTGVVTTGTWNSTLLSSNYKLGVVAVSVNDITLSSLFAGDPIDDVMLVDGDRVLLTNQGTASQNGIWVVHNSSAVPTRPLDYASTTNGLGRGLAVFVSGGTVYASHLFFATNKTITVDTTGTIWVDIASNNTVTGLTDHYLVVGNGADPIGASSVYFDNDANLAVGCKLTLVSEPTLDTDAATMGYVDTEVNGRLTETAANGLYVSLTNDYQDAGQVGALVTAYGYATTAALDAYVLDTDLTTALSAYTTTTTLEANYTTTTTLASTYATQAALNTAVQGLTIKAPCKTMAYHELDNATRSGKAFLYTPGGTTLTIGGVTVSLNDRILNNTDTSGKTKFNGIYTYVSSTNTDPDNLVFRLERPADMLDENLKSGSFVFIEQGDRADLGYVLTTDSFTNHETNGNTGNLTFSPFSKLAPTLASNGLTRTEATNTLSLDASLATGVAHRILTEEAVSINTTAQEGKLYIVNTSAGDVTITIPPTADNDRGYISVLKKVGANHLYIKPSNGDSLGVLDIYTTNDAWTNENRYDVTEFRNIASFRAVASINNWIFT